MIKQFDADDKNKQHFHSYLSKYKQQSLKAQGGQTYISSEDRLYKALVHINGGGAIQEVYRTLFFKSVAFILHFVKSKYRCENIGTNGDYLT